MGRLEYFDEIWDSNKSRSEIMDELSQITDYTSAILLDRFEFLLARNFSKVRVRSGACELIGALSNKNIDVAVISATPSDVLPGIVQDFFPKLEFALVQGGGYKSRVILQFLAKYRISPCDALLFGDGFDDLLASQEAKIKFHGVSGWTLEESGYRGPMINDYFEIASRFGLAWECK